MTVEDALLHLKVDGWCVIEGVIPENKVDEIRQSVTASAALTESRNFLAWDPSIAPYLADWRVLGVAEGVFGSHVRIGVNCAKIRDPGTGRDGFHADWPHKQTQAGHIPAPYPDATMSLTTIWMLSPFSAETGGTLIVPGSHRTSNDPEGSGVLPGQPYPTEMHAIGKAGSVLVFDARLWHASAPNLSDRPRVGFLACYQPRWLNLDVFVAESPFRARIVEGEDALIIPRLPADVYEALPAGVKPLVQWMKE